MIKFFFHFQGREMEDLFRSVATTIVRGAIEDTEFFLLEGSNDPPPGGLGELGEE